MASIFSYDPDPPRVASPWLQDNGIEATNGMNLLRGSNGDMNLQSGGIYLNQNAQSNPRVTHLQAEPQDGPVEYKLHLLLRPRRRFKSISTGARISGSRHQKVGSHESDQSFPESSFESAASSDALLNPASSTQQTRQHRLEQLTTQLLWRLQQSSPHHSSSATNVILPSLPDPLPELSAPQTTAKLLHGLEESRGALYEIGVSDDGTLVGLVEDEMKESLNNLRAMAACLGCTVEVLREEDVGTCEWVEEAVVNGKECRVVHAGKLVVVEALVKPSLQSRSPSMAGANFLPGDGVALEAETSDAALSPSTEQLRITLTGPTMCGKSSLLGTLTTSTLDNGRGKSRISMLKHRHEISSGVTSSVTQELLGYTDKNDDTVEVVNYATDNVASWIDIHGGANGNRLVFISDSAGHPRYRRTIIRGLVGWAPHWTLLCIPADDTETVVDKAGNTHANQRHLGSAVTEMDLSGAQLDLCLKLHLPLVIVITKLDVASKAGLKSSLTKVLDAIKAAGRKPTILANKTGDSSELDLQTLDSLVIEGAYSIALPLLNNVAESVPIVLTSSVHGTGIRNLHALLHELPIPERSDDHLESYSMVFHIEDVYSKPAEMEGVVVSGRLRVGRISIGDSGTVGPFSVDDLEDSDDSDGRATLRRPSQLPASRSFPGALRTAHVLPRLRLPNEEWRRFTVRSIRNLRLPVHSLLPDQVGTIAIVPDDADQNRGSRRGFNAIRKGMVLTSMQPLSTRTFVAQFKREELESLAVGNHVVVYIASVRAPARVVSARVPDSPLMSHEKTRRVSETQPPFDLDDIQNSGAVLTGDAEHETVAGAVTAPNLLVTFHFDAGKEFVMVGDQVLVMPGGGPGLYGGLGRGEKGLAGLDGFVGRVVETYG